MLAHRPLIFALVAGIGLVPQPSLSAGMISIVRPATTAMGPGGHGFPLHPGRDHGFGRHDEFRTLAIGSPIFVPPPQAPTEPASLPAQPTTFEPLVIAAPQCVPPKAVERVGPRIIYVSEASAAPTHEERGVTIIYGRPGW
jgi:hypothetical protein